MIKNNKLLIDRECPLCRAYGKGFQNLNWIDENTVTYYQSCQNTYADSIDMERAKSEIAFFNPHSGETRYGIDALIDIIWEGKLAPVLKFKPVYWIIKKLYRFVSFNRKVIAPSSSKADELICTPPIHLGYRMIYLAMSIIITTLTIHYLYNSLLPHKHPSSILIEFGTIVLPFFAQSCMLQIFGQKGALEYLGHMATVALISSFLLLPAVLIYKWADLNEAFLLIAIILVAIISFIEVRDRTKIINQSRFLNYTWLIFQTTAQILLILSIF